VEFVIRDTKMIEEEKSEMENRRRKEKRKAMKKMKRKERRKEIAEKVRLEEEALLNDPEEQKKMLMLEQEEAERIERDRIAFQEREKAWIIKQQQREEEDDDKFNEDLDNKEEEEEDIEEVEDGPPEIIWQGNEIIIKKKKVNPPNLLLLHHQVCYVQVILSLSRFLIIIQFNQLLLYTIHSFIRRSMMSIIIDLHQTPFLRNLPLKLAPIQRFWRIIIMLLNNYLISELNWLDLISFIIKLAISFFSRNMKELRDKAALVGCFAG
jgi:hypothetical protein